MSLHSAAKQKLHVETLRMVVEAVPTGEILIDRTANIVLVDSHVESLFGYSKKDLAGQPVEMLLPQRFRAKHWEHLASAQPHDSTMGRELYGLHKHGRESPVEIGLKPLATEEVDFVVALIVDMVTRKEARKTLQRALAEQSQDLKGQRLAALSIAEDVAEAIRGIESSMTRCPQSR